MALCLTRERIQLTSAARCSFFALCFSVFLFVQLDRVAALDVGLSGGAAGLGAGVSAGVGSEGLSAGVGLSSGGNGVSAGGGAGLSGVSGSLGANADTVGGSANAGIGASGLGAGGGISSGSSGASAGGSVGPSGGSGGLGANGGAGSVQGSVGGAGVSRGGTETPTGNSTSSADPSASDGRTSGSIASIAPPTLAASSVAEDTFPESLWPVGSGEGDGGWFRSLYSLQPLRAKPGTSLNIVQSCRSALIQGALRYGATQVDVASAGRTTRVKGGGLSAPVEARIVYQRGSRVQVRQARVTCRLDATGRRVVMF